MLNRSEAEALHAEAHEACERATGDLRGGDNPGHCGELLCIPECSR